MNRPLKQKYTTEYTTTHDGTFSTVDWVMYCKELEKYCDFLEEENYCFGKVYSESVAYERALDKACVLLEDGYEYEYPKIRLDYMNVKQWKEWLLKDEQTK